MAKRDVVRRIDFDGYASALAKGVAKGTITTTTTPAVATPQMSVSPETNISASGYPGDDFTTHSLTYTLTNTGTVAVAWSVSHVASWVTISAASGTLAVGASTTVTVSVNSGASLLSAGQRMDFIDFYGDVA